MEPQIIKNRLFGARRSDFEILEGFWRTLIFDDLLGRPRVVLKSKTRAFGWPGAARLLFLVGPTECVGPLGEVRMGQTPPNSEKKE